MTAAPLVEVSGASLCFRLYTQRSHSLRDLAARVMSRRGGRHYRDLWALKGVTLRAGQGDRVAIVGPNGAGKTTLLRLIAGVFPPTEGSVAVTGRVVPLLELGLGFSGELTGAENVRLSGVLLGLTRREARSAAGRVLEFAGLEEFADVPVKYYSSGMAARLAFSVASESRPDVLLLDEVFAVGDMHWVKRAEDRMGELLDRARAVLMVSHHTGVLKRICSRAVYLDRGGVVAEGTVGEVIAAYESNAHAASPGVIDNRAGSASRLDATLEGGTLRVRARSLPLLGECWVGVFSPGATRHQYFGWRRVSPDSAEATFDIAVGQRLEARLYRWSPSGETLEASVEVGGPAEPPR